MPEYPIQIGKVQAPPLRDETLERPRLLDWLNVKIHRRVVLITAEAGYGKTTLLADFSRRSRVRTAWYRLDRGDRDWVGFLAYLVAAVRVHIPDFAPVTSGLLRESAGTPPPRDSVVDTFVRELGALPNDPTALIFDDLHLVDDSVDVRAILRELVDRAPERVTLVLISRRQPPVPLARLRAQGEIAELRTSELRFDADETAQLFRETYALAIEPTVVAELSRRTEGWAASLQLVRAAIRDRSPSEIRSFVGSLSGAEGDLYDYLAEEVVGELDLALQRFLMQTSLLEIVEPVLGSVAAGTTVEQARAAIAEGELLGLLSRAGGHAREQTRFHPLVREFLQARLVRSVGGPRVADIHRAIARSAEPLNWRVAAHHFVAAGEVEHARGVLRNSIDAILSTGAYLAAEEVARRVQAVGDDPQALVVLSRIAHQQGHASDAQTLAEAAFALDPTRAAVALTVANARQNAGDFAGALESLMSLQTGALPRGLALVVHAGRLGILTSTTGSVVEAADALSEIALLFDRTDEHHYVGVALTNLAYMQLATGAIEDALESASGAIARLETTSSDVELIAARLARAGALARTGELGRARDEIAVAAAKASHSQAIEVAHEAAQIEVLFGDFDRGRLLLEPHLGSVGAQDQGEQVVLWRAVADAFANDREAAASGLRRLEHDALRGTVGFEAIRLWAEATVAFLFDEGGEELARRAQRLAESQGARPFARAAAILATAAAGEDLGPAIAAAKAEPSALSIAADAIALSIANLDPEALDAVATEAKRRPERWRPALRRAMDRGGMESTFRAGSLLEDVGAVEDVVRLRKASKNLKTQPSAGALGKRLARRLAAPVFVHDLGRVRVHVGPRLIDGPGLRRKVLALLCFLVTKPDLSATREEVVDALWPDQAPSMALNSLNQSVYFLRRVFEPSYSEDLTPGYLFQDTETVWLDQTLVASLSRRCLDRIRNLGPAPSGLDTLELARDYTGRFALDFMYEEWAAAYRDSLHASFLRVAESTIRRETDAGNYSVAIAIAERVAEIEPESEDIQQLLVSLYRLTRSFAAAAEQYQHYRRSAEEVGLEVVPMSSLSRD